MVKRPTIQELQLKVISLDRLVREKETEISHLKEMLGFMKSHWSLLQTGTISLEKITEAIAHVLGDMKQLSMKGR